MSPLTAECPVALTRINPGRARPRGRSGSAPAQAAHATGGREVRPAGATGRSAGINRFYRRN